MKLLWALLLASFLSASGLWMSPTAAAATPADSVQIVHPGEGEARFLGGTPVTFKTFVAGDDPDQFSITESPIQPGEGAPFHKHAAESFYVLAGDFEFYAGQPDGSIKTIKASAGDLINIPAGIPHAPKNVGSTSGKLLTITGSDWFQNFLLEASNPAEGEASDLGVPSLAKMAPIAAKYGIEFVDPDHL